MKTYNALVDEIAALHTSYAPPSGFAHHPLALPGQWIPSVVDNTTAAVPGKQPIIVAIGANYATTPSTGPTMASARHRTSYRTKDTILQIYDALTESIESGEPYLTLINPPPADPACCHPPRY